MPTKHSFGGARETVPAVPTSAPCPIGHHLGLPPEDDRTVTIKRHPSPGLRGRIGEELSLVAWDLDFLRTIKPAFPNIFLNARCKDGPLYARFRERMPDGHWASHDLARYLEYGRAYWLFRHGEGPEPPWMGPPIGAVHFNPLDVRPSNRCALLSPAPGTEDRRRRVSVDTMLSVRARVDAVLAGKDPDAEWARLHAEHKARRKGAPKGRSPRCRHPN